MASCFQEGKPRGYRLEAVKPYKGNRDAIEENPRGHRKETAVAKRYKCVFSLYLDLVAEIEPGHSQSEIG